MVPILDFLFGNKNSEDKYIEPERFVIEKNDELDTLAKIKILEKLKEV